jgi:hypothetical protein
VADLRLRRLGELARLKWCLDVRRQHASEAVKRAWTIEFHKHIGKRGVPADHSMCPPTAACRNPDLALKYQWFPVRSQDLLAQTMPIVKECMELPSTMALLDGLASGDNTCNVEAFHSMRCHFATKHTHFKRWGMRNTMAKLHYNENLHRDATYTYDSRQRRLSKTVRKTVRAPPTWGWQNKVIEKVMSEY